MKLTEVHLYIELGTAADAESRYDQCLCVIDSTCICTHNLKVGQGSVLIYGPSITCRVNRSTRPFA